MKQFQVVCGVYPTMITPYKNGKIDFSIVDRLVEWYWNEGCDGIFATCQSSEIFFLSLEERIELTARVVNKAKKLAEKDKSRAPMMIVASGHVSDDFVEQVKELNAIAAQGVDALILISNRMDIENTSDEKWISDTEKLVATLPDDIPFGIYECPKPYKRLLTEKMIAWCAGTHRFHFIKDTCCDAEIIKHRIALCQGTPLKIFNANAQTLLETLRAGAAGYCGVMANFHPSLYSKLFRNQDGERTELLQDFLSMAASVENFTYPCCAKYYLDKFEQIPMEYFARSNDESKLTDYQKSCVDQMTQLAEYFRNF